MATLIPSPLDQLFTLEEASTPIPIYDDEILQIQHSTACTQTYTPFVNFPYRIHIIAVLLTDALIRENIGFYPAWIYRLRALESLAEKHAKAIQEFWQKELDWLDRITLSHPKNYQVWQHRQNIITKFKIVSIDEFEMLDRFLFDDLKNYHIWSYRIWLVQTYHLWDGELERANNILSLDHFNNSAWNYKYFLISQHFLNQSTFNIQDELQFIATMSELGSFNRALEYYQKAISKYTI